MKNFYKKGYLDCISAIRKDALLHKDEITFDVLIERLEDYWCVIDFELESDIDLDELENNDENELLALMSKRGQ